MSLTDITFTENGLIDVVQLNALYQIVGWDQGDRLTEEDSVNMLKVSHYYITAHTSDKRLVGFARIWGDPYTAQVLDINPS